MSIFKKISILFIISFILMSIIGLWIDSINSNRIETLVKDKYIKIAQEILSNIDNKQKIDNIVNKYKLKEYDKSKKNNEILFKQEHTFGFIAIEKNYMKMNLLFK